MTIGDVLAVVFGIFGVWLSGWALMVGVAVTFSGAAHRGKEILLLSPVKAALTGLLAWVVFGGLGIFLANHPNGGVKLLGFGILLVLLGISALGGGSIATLVAERVHRQDPGLSPLTALTRAAAFVVLPLLLPLFGWFLLIPALLIFSLGLALRTLFHRSSSVPVESPHREARGYVEEVEPLHAMQGTHES